MAMGIGGARRAPQSKRQQQISQAGRAAKQGRVKGQPQVQLGPGAPAREGTRGALGGRPGGGGGGNLSGGPGMGASQLSRRVSSGAITQEQAQRTLQQRQTLAKAYGPNWRDRVFGPGGARAGGADAIARRNRLLQAAREGTMPKAASPGIARASAVGGPVAAPAGGVASPASRRRRTPRRVAQVRAAGIGY